MKRGLILGVLIFIFCRAAFAMDHGECGQDSISTNSFTKVSQEDVVMLLDSFRTHLMIHSVGEPDERASFPRCTSPQYFERLYAQAKPFLEKLLNSPELLTQVDLPEIEEAFLLPRIQQDDYKLYVMKNYRLMLGFVYEIYKDIAQTFIGNESIRRVILPLLEICIARINAGLLPEDGYASQDNFSLRRVKGLALRVSDGFKFLTVQEFTDIVGRCVFRAAFAGELHEKARVLAFAMQRIHAMR